MKSVAIIGAGLAGLTAARYLSAADYQVTVFESSSEVGGRVRTQVIDGYRCDQGFQVINSQYPEVKKTGLINTLDFQTINPNVRLIDSHKEFLVGRNHPWRLLFSSPGERTALLDEFLTGVFLAEPGKIAPDISRKIKGSFLFGKPGVPAHGVGEFSKALAASVKDIRFKHHVSRVSGNSMFGDFGEIKADAIIVTTNARVANSLLNLYMPHETLSSTTWYHTTHDELYMPRYMAIPRNSAIVNSIVISEVSPAYAPQGQHLVATTTLHNLPEERIRKELAHLWGASTWELVSKIEIPDSLPFMSRGSKRPIIRVSESTVLAGDYLQSPSQQGAMLSGRAAAAEIIQSTR